MGNIRSSQHRKHNTIVSPFSFLPETDLLAPNHAQPPVQLFQAYLELPGAPDWFFERVSIHCPDTSTGEGQSQETWQGSVRQTAAQENTTGLPDHLKTGIESFSGLSLDDVRVHYNSPKPAEVQALAYTQGSEIHVGPGQEQHLAHEAWHVVQQKQGRVQPTLQMNGIAINNDVGLEQEATVMGARGEQSDYSAVHVPAHMPTYSREVLQGEFKPSAILVGEEEEKYELKDVKISAIDMSKNKRPPTRLVSRQGSHIVAWELKVRQWQEIFTGSGDKVLKELKKEADEDDTYDTEEGSKEKRQKLLNNLVTLGSTNKRSLSEWTQLLGNAIALYIRVYQASSFTVFGGKRTPKGHGEAPALDKLTKWNAGKETAPNQDVVVQTVVKLLDIIPGISPKIKEKGLKDWSTALSTLFPKLFEQGLLKELQPQDISTLAQRTTKDELAKRIRGTGSSPAITVDDEDIEDVEMVETEEEEKKAGEEEEAESIREPFVVVASVDTTLPETAKQKFSADKITVAIVMIPDERPSTQFKSGQGSHTIAWSLERRAWESLFGAGQLLKDVMDNLKNTLDADTKWEKETTEVKGGKSLGLSSSRTALKQQVESSVVEHSLSDWTKLLNEWIKRYVELYQKSSFATFTETEKSGATTPTGHGEGTALRKLDLWETLLNKKEISKLPTDGGEVAQTALALLDIGTWAVTRTNVAIKELLERWKDDFKRAFPKVFDKYQKDIEDALDTLQKSDADPFDPNAPRKPRKRKGEASGAESAKKQTLAGTH